MSDSGRRTLKLCTLLFAALLVWGCEGDNGRDGAQGPAGPTGPAGPAGPVGPSGGVPVTSAATINVEITGVAIPAGGGAPTVDVTLTNDLKQGLTGLPAGNIRFIIAQLTAGSGGGSSEWQSYTTRDSGGIADAQATTETATAGTYTDNGDGTYTYTFSQALTAYPAGPTYDETKTHRLGLEIRTNSGGFLPDNIPANNAPYDFVPAGGAPLETRLIVDNDTCNACHDNLEFHGEARFDIEYCVQCHNPSSIDGDSVNEPWGGSVDMTLMTHKIHYGASLANGYFVVGFGNRTHDYSDVLFPQDVRNCETCHNESDMNTPQASNWREVANRNACGACHDDIEWEAGGHGGVSFFDDTQCLDCHGPNSTVTDADGNSVKTADAHALLTQIESGKFQYNILSITDTAVGETLTIEFSVTDPTNGDAPYNIQTDTAFTTCAGGASRLAIGLNWNTDDYTNTGSGSTPAQPIAMNPLTACGGTSTDVGNGVFSVTSPLAIPADASGSLAVTIDGHPAVDIDGTIERIAVTNAVDYAAITDPDPVPRRALVDIEKCDDCHNQLSVHGNNRTDEPQVCVTCHNPNATDARQRIPVAMPAVPPSDCVNVLGADDVTIDMKYMIHAIHAGGAVGTPYEVCGFRNSVHVYDFVYPGKLENCEGCHNPDTYYPVDPSAVLGTTVDVGADAAVPTDDTAISPNSAVCSTCHVSDLAMQHMVQNGGDFNATKAADSSLISSGVETCQLCHGPGRSSDVKEVHGVGEFRFN